MLRFSGFPVSRNELIFYRRQRSAGVSAAADTPADLVRSPNTNLTIFHKFALFTPSTISVTIMAVEGYKLTGEDIMKKKVKTWKLVLLGVFLFILALAAVCYGAVTRYYTNHFFKGTEINNFDCSNLTVAEVKELINGEIMTYAVSIEERDGITERLLAKELGMSYVDDQSVDKVLAEQKAWQWVVEIFKTREMTVTAVSSYDKQVASAALKELQCFQEGNYTKPEDAYIKEGETSYEIVPAVEGTELDFDKVLETVLNAVDNHEESVNLDEAGCYIEPNIKSDDESLVARVNNINKYLSANLTYDFGGDDRKVVVDGSVIKEWMQKGEDGLPVLNEDGEPTIVETALQEFVRVSMAKKYDTLGKPHDFKKHDGETITLTGGFYGWRMNQAKTSEAMLEAIKAGEQKEMEVFYHFTAANRGADDIGGTYVEVDITHQKVYCYEDGKVKVETDVVTGKPTEDRETPSNGIWSIIYKKKDAVLGEENDLEYRSPVDFWMPFNGNVGLHDADRWRSQYGGNIYKTNGSHGCVNMPREAAEKVFNIVNKGTPVIVYGE